MFINGKWISSIATFPVHNPATGEHLDDVTDGTKENIYQAIEAADAAFPAWSTTTAHFRSSLLMRAHDLMLQNKEHLAQVMTSEQGKPLAAARNEVQYGADFLLWFAEEAKKLWPDHSFCQT